MKTTLKNVVKYKSRVKYIPNNKSIVKRQLCFELEEPKKLIKKKRVRVMMSSINISNTDYLDHNFDTNANSKILIPRIIKKKKIKIHFPIKSEV